MVPQPPTTRLREVALGLGALARELEPVIDTAPRVLLWWQRQILDAVGELEAGQPPRRRAADD